MQGLMRSGTTGTVKYHGQRSHCHARPAINPQSRTDGIVARRSFLTGIMGLGFIAVNVPSSGAKPNLLDVPSCASFTTADNKVQYCDVVKGSGPTPEEGDLIVVDYTARAVATGEVFSGSRNFKFIIGQDEELVIPGWKLGILGGDGVPAIKQGGTRTVLIPANLAYGSVGKACYFGLENSCMVPPDSPIEITFAFKGFGY